MENQDESNPVRPKSQSKFVHECHCMGPMGPRPTLLGGEGVTSVSMPFIPPVDLSHIINVNTTLHIIITSISMINLQFLSPWDALKVQRGNPVSPPSLISVKKQLCSHDDSILEYSIVWNLNET